MLSIIDLPYRISDGASFEQMIDALHQIYDSFFNRYEAFPAKVVMPRESFEALRTTRLPTPSGELTSLTALRWLMESMQVKIEIDQGMEGVILASGSTGLMLFGKMPSE